MRKNLLLSLLIFMVTLFAVGLVACGKSLKSFKVNFVVDNEVVKTIEATNKEEILLPEEPKKEGYTFDGWYMEKEDGKKVSMYDLILISDTTLHAKWLINAYTITYNLNGGNNNDNNPSTYTVEDEIVLLNPLKKGYTFDGWTENSIETFQIDKGSTGNKEYTANWIANTYTLTINYYYKDSKNKIADTYIERIKYDSSYYIKSPIIENYVANNKIVDGIMNKENIVVDVYYDTLLNLQLNSDKATYNLLSLKDKSITSVFIPSNVSNIASSVFQSCYSLTNITVDENNPYYKSINGNLYSKDGKTLIQYSTGKQDKEFIIPDGVTNIGDQAFRYCSRLTSILIPDSVVSIGRDVFNNYVKTKIDGVFYVDNWAVGVEKSSIKQVSLKDGTRGVAAWTFAYCSKLTDLTIPNSVINIGDYAFCGCMAIYYLRIPKSVTIIGEKAFYNCSSLWGVSISADTKVGDNAFCGSNSLDTIYYYGTESQWQSIRWNFYFSKKCVVHCNDGDINISGERY